MLPRRGHFLLKRKYTGEQKIEAVKEYLVGKSSQGAIAKRLGITKTSLQRWIMKYQSMGVDAFFKNGNKQYSRELKNSAISYYLSGNGSEIETCKIFKIHSTKQLRDWIKKYNSHEELKASRTGGTAIMTEGRKTTYKERIEIAAYCIENDHNYAKTAEKYKVSYQQARTYTVKYEKGGIDALQDRRGKRKTEGELSEIERLKAELKLEKAKRKRAEMEAAFLKKLEEIERRRL